MLRTMRAKLNGRGLVAKPADEGRADPRPRGADTVFSDLRVVLGELLVAGGVNATLDAWTNRRAGGDGTQSKTGMARSEWRIAAEWAPLALGPAAGAAHIAHALKPSGKAVLAAQLLSGAAVGLGSALLIDSLRASWRGERPPSLSQVIFITVGAAGLLVHRVERQVAADRSRDVRVRRPSKRRRVNRIVIHA